MSLQVVEYPEYLDLGPYMSQAEGEALHYSLYAVLVHSGASCHGGHYFCYTKVVTNFLPSFPVGKMCVERRNFPVSVTDSQGFGAAGLLRGWPGFLLTYSLLGRFLPVFLERSHAEMLAFFCQASNGLWYRMDDESVQLRCLDTALRQQAYLLFYAR